MKSFAASSRKGSSPLLAKHEGQWEGTFKFYDEATGEVTEQHDSFLVITFPTDGSCDYQQVNK